MNFNRYYQDELAYLRELGSEFSKHNPDLAPYLSNESKDPDIERLIEAFAFLTGRLRERLDDHLPEVIHGLLTVLWPQALRPIPCTTTLELEPVKGVVGATEIIPSRTKYLSKSIEGTACTFVTCQDVKLQPLSIVNAEIEEISGRGSLKITIAPIGNIKLDQIDLDPLKIFLNFHSDQVAGNEIRLLLRRHIQSAHIISGHGRSFSLESQCFRASGFSKEDAVLSPSDASFDSFRVLQEFLTVPEKFFFLELRDLPPFSEYGDGPFTVHIYFDRPFLNLTRISSDHIKLNCATAINMFEMDAEPISLGKNLTEYRLLTTNTNQINIVDVKNVTGWKRGQSERIYYERYETFRRKPGKQNNFYYLRLKPNILKYDFDHYISFLDDSNQDCADIVIAGLSCCNGNIPELLSIGDIHKTGGNAPVSARAKNITPVTPFVPPPLNSMQLWSIISIMARNYYPVAHIDGLRNLLTHLNFRAARDRQASWRQELLASSLQSISTNPCNILIKGYPARGRHITMTVNEEKIEGIGRAFLFGEVMNEFFSLFSNINSCHRFSMHCSQSNMTYDWAMRIGEMVPL